MLLKQSAQSPPLFRSYGPKSTHNTQLTEGVIPPNVGVNLGYIRYMQTSVQCQGHYGGRGGGALGSLMGPSANSNDHGAISAPSFRKSLLALPLRQLCPAESLNPRPRSTSCPRSGSVARRTNVENGRGKGGKRGRGQGVVHATFLEKKEFNSESKSTAGTGSRPRGGSRRTPCQKVSGGG